MDKESQLIWEAYYEPEGYHPDLEDKWEGDQEQYKMERDGYSEPNDGDYHSDIVAELGYTSLESIGIILSQVVADLSLEDALSIGREAIDNANGKGDRERSDAIQRAMDEEESLDDESGDY